MTPSRTTGVSVASPFASQLSLPATGYEVAQFVAMRAAACVGAEYSNFALLNTERSSLRLFHSPFLDPQMEAQYTDVPLDAAYPIAAAAREGRVVLLPNLASYERDFSGLVADTAAAGIQATASLPLYRFDGPLLGAIGFGWVDPMDFSPKLEAALRAVANLCVETVERAERYDADHELILALQDRLLPVLPVLSGAKASARYLTSESQASVGGDWYEGLLLGPGRMAFIVGDVVGHGITAAADMALIRGMISALLHAGVAPSQIFTELTDLLVRTGSPLLATAALAVVDIPAATITYATAGHPAPMLRLPDGTVEMLDDANGILIGASIDLPRTAGAAPFPVGARLVMYTDGLVERQDRPFDEGVHEAAAHLAAIPAHLEPTQVVESLIGALIGDTTTVDDVAVLVVEHHGKVSD